MGGREINEERLRLLARYLARQEAVARVDTFPPEKPDRIVARFEPSLFPAEVRAVRLELRLRLDGEFNCQYVEEWPADRWTCRWDRHENHHSDRDHFHPPPSVDEERAVSCELPDDPNDLVGVVLSFVENRIDDLWGRERPVYPDEYEYRGEYGPGR